MTPDLNLQLGLYTKSLAIPIISQSLYCISTNLCFLTYFQNIRNSTP